MPRWVALTGLAILTFLVGIGRPAIQDADEAFYAESGREMVASGDWITPHYDGAPRTNKPILFYWLVAADDRAMGVTEGAARLWSGLAGVGLALVAAGISRRWLGAGPEVLAGGIVATSLGLTRLGRSALPDVPLAVFVTVAIWAGFEVGRAQTDAGRRGWLWLGALSAALGFLTKGPVAWVIIALTLGPALLWDRWGPDRHRPWQGLRVPDVAGAVALVVIVTVPWFALATAANGPAFLHNFFVGENVDRFLTDRFNVPQPVWYYLPVVAGGLLPWSPCLVLLISPIARTFARRRPSALAIRLVSWAGMPLLFFTLSTGKQPRYILPCLVPLAVLLAREIWRRLQAPDGWLIASGVAMGALLTTIGGLAYRLSPVLRAADPFWTPVGPAVLAAAGLLVVLMSIVGRPRVMIASWLMAAGLSAVAIEATVFWPSRPEPVERIGARIAAEAPDSPVCSCSVFTRNLPYYAHVPTVVRDTEPEIAAFLTGTPGSLAVVDDLVLSRIEGQLHRHFARLLVVPYLDPARLRVGDFLRDPDPMKVRTVILVRTE